MCGQKKNYIITLSGLLVVAITAAIYSPVVGYDFVAWDDALHVYDNPRFHPVTWAHVGAFWRQSYEYLYIPVTYNIWAAVAWLSQRIAPGSYTAGLFHTLNLLLHLLNILVVHRLVILLLDQHKAETMVHTAGMAGVAALIFGLHPLQVEAMAWVSGLKDILAGCWGLIALWQYLACVQAHTMPRRQLHYGLATAAFILALLAKPSAVVVPALAWVLATSGIGQSWKQAAQWLGPWLCGAILWSVWTKSQQPDTAIVSLTPVWTRPLIALDTITFYLGKLFWPVALGTDYGRTPQSIVEQGWHATMAILPIGLLVLWWKRRAYWGLWLAAAVFSIGLLPVLGFVPFLFQGHSTVADRYTYLSLLGPAIGLAWAGHRTRPCGTLTLVGLLVLGLIGWKSYTQVHVWQNTETLFTHALRVNPRSLLAHNNMGFTFAEQGRLDEAMAHYRQALQVRPDSPYTYNNFGLALAHRGNLEAAIAAYTQAIHLRPDYVNAHNNLGLALVRQGQPVEAMEHFTQALAIVPDSAETHNNLGIALAAQEKYGAAMQQFAHALQLKPDHAKAYFNLGMALSRLDQHNAAIAAMRMALQLRPTWPEAATQLAWLILTHTAPTPQMGAEAVTIAEQACAATQYRDSLAVFVLAVAYQAAQRTSQAYETAQQALKLALIAVDTDIVAQVQAYFPGLAQKEVWYGMP
jgi:Tfp pilus assembly protein PilF